MTVEPSWIRYSSSIVERKFVLFLRWHPYLRRIPHCPGDDVQLDRIQGTALGVLENIVRLHQYLSVPGLPSGNEPTCNGQGPDGEAESIDWNS
ncbi:MAG: hypothetical protein WBY44_09450, partial [Bryobacteraceae bacterium]